MENLFDLSGKVAIVTGTSRGLGQYFGRALAKAGADLVITSRDPGRLTAFKDEIEGLGRKALPVKLDVLNESDIEGMVRAAMDEYGQIDILVNNAGITRDGLIARMSENDWDSVLNTNLKGAFLCSKAVTRTMMKKRWGRIINVSSVVGFVGNGGQVNYAAAKAGLTGLTKSMARELAGRNITVNCVAPGYIVTDMTDGLTEDVQETLKAQIPLGILGTPEDVAAAVAFLASADSNYVTGQTLHVNGGMYMGH